MANNRTRPTAAARPARRAAYIGFWAEPNIKDMLKRTAKTRRQSMSALTCAIVEDYFVRARMGLA